MGSPRFVPKDFTPTPAAFGEVATIAWHKPNSVQAAIHLNAAQWQHAQALAIRAGIRTQFAGSTKQYARELGTSYDRLLKVLRGDLVMQSEDVGRAAVALDNFHREAANHLNALQPARRFKARE